MCHPTKTILTKDDLCPLLGASTSHSSRISLCSQVCPCSTVSASRAETVPHSSWHLLLGVTKRVSNNCLMNEWMMQIEPC